MESVRYLGYDVGIYTNGTSTDIIKKAIRNRFVQYVAVDFKAPLNKYNEFSDCFDKNSYCDLAKTLVNSNIKYEYKTTIYPNSLKEVDLIEMADWIRSMKIENYTVQETKSNNSILEFDNNIGVSDSVISKIALAELKASAKNFNLKLLEKRLDESKDVGLKLKILNI